jgi:hypothetical protein
MDRRTRRWFLERLRRDAERIAGRFDLEYRSIDAEDSRVKRRYGSCERGGRVRIRLTHARTGKPLKYSSLIDTLCHELAHLRYFHHGPAFHALYAYLLDWAREQDIYRPSPRGRKGIATVSAGDTPETKSKSRSKSEDASREPAVAEQLQLL